MPQLVKDLLGGCSLSAPVEIDAVEGSPGNWFLREKAKAEGTEPGLHGPFTAVVLTAPAPQTFALLRNVECTWKSRLQAASYHPCWALMASFRNEKTKPQKSSDIFATIVSQNKKPGRKLPEDVQSWIAHATPEWSRSHLEDEAIVVQSKLLAELTRVLDLAELHPIHVAVHRWRYSTVANALSCTALSDAKQGLFFAGDACAGTGVAGAIESGLAVGQMLFSD
jgi:predicted NAD/FAD-dependent oxidoreductase